MNTRKILKAYREEFDERIKYEFPHPISFANKFLASMIYQAMRLSEFMHFQETSHFLYRAYVTLLKELKQGVNHEDRRRTIRG